MGLDPEVSAVLEALRSAGAPELHTLSPEAGRQMYEEMNAAGVGAEVARVEDRKVPGPGCEIPIRVYTPSGEPPFAALVYYHGGGWVIGSLDTHDHVCRSLADGAGCVVVAVDYRLAPEAKFPAAADDCFAATRWVAENSSLLGTDPGRLAVGGDSAGGNLAAVVALMSRDAGAPALKFQLLVYPVTDHNFATASYRDNADGYLLTQTTMRWFWNHYLPDPADGKNPLASPLRAPSLDGLPPALVVTAEFDPLRDEGEAYARRLQEAGVATTLRRYDGQIHGFFNMANVLTQAQTAHAEACAALREAFVS